VIPIRHRIKEQGSPRYFSASRVPPTAIPRYFSPPRVPPTAIPRYFSPPRVSLKAIPRYFSPPRVSLKAIPRYFSPPRVSLKAIPRRSHAGRRRAGWDEKATTRYLFVLVVISSGLAGCLYRGDTKTRRRTTGLQLCSSWHLPGRWPLQQARSRDQRLLSAFIAGSKGFY